MRISFSFLLLLLVTATNAQEPKPRPYTSADYPASTYSVKADTFTFKNFKISLIQARLINAAATPEGNPSYCKIWLKVLSGNKTIDSIVYGNSESLGGCSGVFAGEQPDPNHFILSKFGDYDGNILIINAEGKIQKYHGGEFFLSEDGRVLISVYDSDQGGITIFDLLKDKLMYTSDNLKYFPRNIYCYNGDYFADAGDNDTDDNGIVTYQIELRNGIVARSVVEEAFVKKATKLKVYNRFTLGPCACGQTK